MGAVWNWFATAVGDTWVDSGIVALWFWPAVLWGGKKSLMTWSDYRAFSHKLQPGDFIIMQSAAYKGSNKAIAGSFKHLAVYVGPVRGEQEVDGDQFIMAAHTLNKVPDSLAPDIHARCVVHAISEGVVCQDLGQVLMHADYAMAVRAWGRESERQIIVSGAMKQLGKPYDFDFAQSDDERLYCTELGVSLCRAAAIVLPPTIQQKLSLFGPPTEVTVADGFFVFKPVCCSRSCLKPKFAAESAAPLVAQQAISEAWEERNK